MREKLARLLDGLTGTVRLGYDDPRYNAVLVCVHVDICKKFSTSFVVCCLLVSTLFYYPTIPLPSEAFFYVLIGAALYSAHNLARRNTVVLCRSLLWSADGMSRCFVVRYVVPLS